MRSIKEWATWRHVAVDGFMEWLVSPEGQDAEHALFEVVDALENCHVEPSDRAIIWDDGERLSITQSAQRIQMNSDLSLHQIEPHIVGWLEMTYIPEGLNEQEWEQFENKVLAWTDSHKYS